MARKRKPPNAPPPPEVTAETPLSEDETVFVNEFLIDRVSAAAYRRAFPGCSYQSAFRLGSIMRRRVNVAAEIDAGITAQRIRNNVSADGVINELKRIAFSDIYQLYDPATNQLREPRHIPYDLRKAVASVKISRERRSVSTRGRTRTTVTQAIVEYRFWDKVAALGKLMRHLGLEVEIPPLDVLLAALPRQLAEQVRTELARERTAVPHPSTNGTH